ncbi:APC family permease [Pseudooceanicola sp. CBS1P-1]|uniref:Amino acid permease n=1 Tax=Pseudooceanicola albus TaxID=2692189 RepID=A0A6L7G8T1_9RHOB|nr:MULTISPECIES: APC family permease [Pseudooceanicola]MBT9384334.1 APC family permease [Pseudooceanicola endophyticus]MXN19928.1 amino acid permease [Pseudooceanicola albus]
MADTTFSQQGDGGLRRDAGKLALLFVSTTSMVGSGWLFGAYHAAKIAGPYAIWSWIVGAAIVLLIALCFAELAALFPRSGALVHMSHASHGAGLGRIWSWLLYLAYAPVAAVETEAVVTYANNYLPFLLKPGGDGTLTITGFVVCALLLLVIAALNLQAVSALMKVNTVVTWWKIAVPLVTVVALIAGSHHWGVWQADPEPGQFDGIFTALPAAGIVFSFLGFRSAIDMGGEAANPGRAIPLAVIGSVLLAAVLYVLLQLAFILALSPGDLANGWASLSFAGDAGPFAGLAAALGFGWVAALLYVDAYVSPGGTGLIYLTGGSRILYAVGETGTGPAAFAKLSKNGVPWVAIAVMWVTGVFFLLPFPAWQKLVGYITSITVITYGLGPIVLLVLRRNQPEAERAFRLPFAGVLAPLAFICSNLIIYWTGFQTNSVLFLLMIVLFALYAGHHHLLRRRTAESFGWGRIGWLLPWFGGMWILSALSDVGGGLGLLPFWPGVVLTAVWSLIVVRLALRAALPAEETARVLAGPEEGFPQDL